MSIKDKRARGRVNPELPAPGPDAGDSTRTPEIGTADFATRLARHMSKAAREAMTDLHNQGIPAHGVVKGEWTDIAPPSHAPSKISLPLLRRKTR